MSSLDVVTSDIIAGVKTEFVSMVDMKPHGSI